MDTIRFEVKHPNEVAVFINGRDLIEMLREVELPFATREGYPSWAGNYQGIAPTDLFEDIGVLLGEPAKGWNCIVEGKATLLGHTCGDVGCWPMCVKVTVEEKRIIWSNFEQPHRAARMEEQQWTYEALGPFVFDSAQYMAEVERMVQRSRQAPRPTEP
jgi:hypothetical protein